MERINYKRNFIREELIKSIYDERGGGGNIGGRRRRLLSEMNAMICLGHFCEVHGPTSVMCTQALSANHSKAEIKYHSVSSNLTNHPSTCLSCEFKVPIGSSTPASSSTSSTTSSPTGGSIVSPSCVKTDIKPGVVCVSSHYPASQSRYTAIRQTCLRMLSSEHTFNDSTPMLFSDPSIGSAIILVFMVHDESSRGNVRRYGITCVCEDERLLVESWNIIVPQIEQLSKSIQKRATIQSQKQNSTISSSYSGGPERYLRKRDSVQPAKSLATIVNDEDLFIEIHARFTKILAELQHFI